MLPGNKDRQRQHFDRQVQLERLRSRIRQCADTAQTDDYAHQIEQAYAGGEINEIEANTLRAAVAEARDKAKTRRRPPG